MTNKKEIRIKGWEIAKSIEDNYMLNIPNMDTIIHCNKLVIGAEMSCAWLYLYEMHDGFKSMIGSIWIDNKGDIDKLKELIEA